MFEFDPLKSQANYDKHGIDFASAQKLWEDACLKEFVVREQGEKRYVVIGMIENDCWAAVITYRKDAIRIISVRRARRKERKLYDDNSGRI